MGTSNVQVFQAICRSLGAGIRVACAPAWWLPAMAVLHLGWVAARAGAEPPSKKPDTPQFVSDVAPRTQPAKAVRGDTTVEAGLSIQAHSPQVRFALFSQDGRRLYTGGDEKGR